MKKILQRIGVLAAAVMLLWGYQGMEAKADYTYYTPTTPADSHMTAHYTYYSGANPTIELKLTPDEGYTFEAGESMPEVTINRGDGTVEKPEGRIKRNSTFPKDIYVLFQLSAPLTGNDTLVFSGGAVRKALELDARHPQLAKTDAARYFLVYISANYWFYERSYTDLFTYTFTDAAGNSANQYFKAELDYDADYNSGIYGSGYFCVTMIDDTVPFGNYRLEITDPTAKVTESLDFTVQERIRIGEIELTAMQELLTVGQPLPAIWQVYAYQLKESGPAITWTKDGQPVTGNVEYNTTYKATFSVTPADGFYFSDAISIYMRPEMQYDDIKLENGILTLTYSITTEADPSRDPEPGEDNNNNNNNPPENTPGPDSNNSPEQTDPGSDSNNNTDNSSIATDSEEETKDLYKIIEGAKGIWYGSTKEGLTFRGDGDFSKFAGVRVDGNWIPGDHYEAKSGSTIVTLKPSYLASLAAGEHTLSIMWIDDSASTTFTVASGAAAAQSELDNVPKTGEGVQGWMPEVLLLVAAGLVTAGVISRKQSKINR